jgi:transcriptional regulator with XRE-family HTH domain
MNDFANWLNEQIDNRGWSQNEFARRAGVSQAQVSNVIGGYKAGEDFCVGVARAFGLTRREVFARAGIIEPEPDGNDPTNLAMLYEFARLPKEDQAHLLKEARALNAYGHAGTDSQPG